MVTCLVEFNGFGDEMGWFVVQFFLGGRLGGTLILQSLRGVV